MHSSFAGTAVLVSRGRRALESRRSPKLREPRENMWRDPGAKPHGKGSTRGGRRSLSQTRLAATLKGRAQVRNNSLISDIRWISMSGSPSENGRKPNFA